MPLHDGDEILMGRQVFVYCDASSAGTTRTDAGPSGHCGGRVSLTVPLCPEVGGLAGVGHAVKTSTTGEPATRPG